MSQSLVLRFDRSVSFGACYHREVVQRGTEYFERSRFQRTGRAEARWSPWRPATEADFKAMPYLSTYMRPTRLPKAPT